MNKVIQPTIVKIEKIIDEGLNYKTFVFNYPLTALPGQYVMLWLPGVDLKPFSVAWQTPEQFALTVLKRGNFTTKLFDLKVGAKLGFTGPHGSFYHLEKPKKILLIGGGCGTPSVTCLAQAAREKKISVDFVLAAPSREQIIFEDWLTGLGVKVYHRFQSAQSQYPHAWDLIRNLFDKNKYQAIYACGPEQLLKKIVDFSLNQNIFCQISMERYMKCAIGVCGKCCVDPLGLCLCQTGPVINNYLASQITEFGKYWRDSSGQKIYFNKDM